MSKELIDKAKEKFNQEAADGWRLNEHILEISIDKFEALKTQGYIVNDEQVVAFSLLMATEFE